MATNDDVRTIRFSDGSELEFEIKPGFYEMIRRRFNLPDDAYVDDSMLKQFMYEALLMTNGDE